MIAQMTFEQGIGLFNYWVVIFLMMTGFYMVIARGNLIKTIIGLNIFQTSVVLLYVTMGKVTGKNAGGAPIMPMDAGHGHEHDDHGHGHEETPAHAADHAHDAVSSLIPSTDHADSSVQLAGFEDVPHGDAVANAADAAELIYSNPLPSVLMLTAIVVGVATTALALALTVRVREDYGTTEEDEILELDRAS
jgi:multicomponent Na+:H+ antiporter subunit C